MDGSSLTAAAVRDTSVATLDTPALLVDLDRLERNITRWQDAADAAGVRLRPHAKTHKSVAIAGLQRDAGAHGIAVAKPSEAEVFAAAGFDDIAIAYPVVGEAKWARVAELATTARITVNVDSATAAEGLSAAAAAVGATVHVQIDLDSGFGRCGVPAERHSRDRGPRRARHKPARARARRRHHPPRPLLPRRRRHDPRGRGPPRGRGRRHGGGAPALGRHPRRRGDGRRLAHRRRRRAGPRRHEVRAGTYVFNDLMQIALGAATREDLALTVLATVVSVTGPDTATIDGGSKTFAGDTGVVGGAGLPLRGMAECVERDAVVERMTEEHGLIRTFDGPLEVGERLTFVPVHACTCVNLAERLFAVRNGEIEHVWPVDARGRTA